jgi:hypothetical protein
MTWGGKFIRIVFRLAERGLKCKICTAAAGANIFDNAAAMQKKRDLPEKTCVQCQRPFRWRKKWERCWDEVRYCSDACRRGTPRGRAGGTNRNRSV